jgi:AcrR family transcriptional regulator
MTSNLRATGDTSPSEDTAEPPATRRSKKEATRELILDTAERLFAEHGIYAVSNRQIAEAAGQGNTAAVGYHFGSRTELIEAMLSEISGSLNVRDWLDCQVRPIIERFDELGAPTWFARVGTQMMTDPELRTILMESSFAQSPTLHASVDGLLKCLPFLPVQVQPERIDCSMFLIIQMCAQRERALANGEPTIRASWSEMATGLVDLLVGIWTAPVTPV